MHHGRSISVCITTLALTALLCVSGSQGATAYRYFPSGDETDGRFLSQTSEDLQTLGERVTAISFAVPKTETEFEIGIFDGDTGGMWDLGSVGLVFSFYADPDADGSGVLLLNQWQGNTMPDNGWFSHTFPTGPEAQAPSGNFFYVMRIESTGAAGTYWSNFKVRTSDFITIAPQAFAFAGALIDSNDLGVIYPNYPDLTNTTYDGTWTFRFRVPETTKTLEIWDGDLDFGSFDLQELDTDDPNTPNDQLPDWDPGTTAQFEGIAVGVNGGTGAPPDDSSFASFRRPPSVRYRLVAPDGRQFFNTNPSGNMEWERFVVSADLTVAADVHTLIPLPPGVYTVEVEGTDLTNLNAFRFPYDIIDEDPPRPYIIGDLVWNDINGNGIYEPGLGEAGIPGVLVQLVDSGGTEVDLTMTDADGLYEFEVLNGDYTVRIAAVNFGTGNPLRGMSSTTGGNEQSGSVSGGNNLDFDFGYQERDEDEVCIFVACVYVEENRILIIASSTNSPFAELTATIPALNLEAPMVSIGDGLYKAYFSFPAGADVIGRQVVVISSDGGTACRNLENCSIVCDSCDDEPGCVQTYTYWKYHPDEWPLDSIVLGETTYTRNEAVAILETPMGLDVTYSMAYQLIAAKLNVAAGADDSCIAEIIASGDAWMINFGPVGSGVTADSPAWQIGEILHGTLEDYNQGLLCAPPCECGDCEGGVYILTLKYLGSQRTRVVVRDDAGHYVFDDFVDPGQPFTFHGVFADGTFRTHIRVYVGDNCNLNTRITTDCTQPIGPGLVSGDFEVVSGESRWGGTLCPVALPEQQAAIPVARDHRMAK